LAWVLAKIGWPRINKTIFNGNLGRDMAKITDINIEYSGQKIPQTPTDRKFRKLANFVTDLYLQYLDGYKPLKVSKIVLDLRLKEVNADFTPFHFGSICTIHNGIDEEKYHSQSDKENLYYLLSLFQSSILKASKKENWDVAPFNKAYDKIVENDFHFLIHLPEEKSKSGIIAIPFIEKDLERTFLKVRFGGPDESSVTLVDKRNTNIFDSIYILSKSLKWFDKNSFGFQIKDLNVKVCHSLSDKNTSSNLEFDDNMMIIPQGSH
jgi:hypothetical protein